MHVASEVREAFLEWLDEAGDDLARLAAVPKELRSRLWHCTDTLPGCYCDQLEAPRGSSYAAAVRLLVRPPWPGQPRFCAS
jgi:hypothetical protein